VLSGVRFLGTARSFAFELVYRIFIYANEDLSMQCLKSAARTLALGLAAPLISPVLAGEAAQEIVLEEIIVTGTLRGQSLAEVPASVTVLDSRTLRDAGQQHFQDVLALVPNLNWAGGTSRPRYFQIRGVGEREQYEGAPNPSVGFLIDDIDFSGLGMPATLFDVGQIEVLRGPQGTQYGANALAGLIVVRGREPQREAAWNLEASGAEFGARSIGLAATGPAAALNSAWRVSLQHARSDGFMRNTFLGREDTNNRDELTARVKWRWFATEDTTLDLTLLHADFDNGYDAWALDNSRTTLSDEPGRDSQQATGGSARLVTAWGGNTLTTIASHARSDSTNSYDSDWGNAAHWAPFVYAYYADFERERATSSFELRLASPEAEAGGAPAWLFGAYALRMKEDGTDLERGDYADPGDPVFSEETAFAHQYRATNLALFGQLDGYFAPRWRWSAGLRLEQRRADYDDPLEPEALDETDLMLGGQVSLSVDLAAGTTAYTSLSRGYKAGGFNLGVLAADPGDPVEVAEAEAARRFDPEYLWNLETGLRSVFAGGRGHADVSVFYQWRSDQQVRTGRQLDPVDPNSYIFVTDNLPHGYTTGLEASMQYALTSSLSAGGSLGLLRSRSGPGSTVDDEGNPLPVVSREQAHAPSYTAALNATWRSARGFMARVDVSAMDAFFFDVPTDHDQKSDAYALVHLKAGYESERWSVHAWLRNAFDKDYAVRGFFFQNEPPDWPVKLYRQLGDPRQLGISASVNF
jgi:iron complex outermembrane receptor protein